MRHRNADICIFQTPYKHLPSALSIPQKEASHKEAQNHMNDLQIFSNPEFGQVRTVELDGRIDQLKIVAFGLPAFDQIMADIFTTEKKE